jgi:hypothetical protein
MKCRIHREQISAARFVFQEPAMPSPRLAHICAASLLAGLSACATGYHSASNPILGLTGGYWDEPGPGQTWRVGVTGNAMLSAERAEQYLLHRCAEVTQREGGTHFVVYASLFDAVSDRRLPQLGVPAGAKPYATVYLWIAPANEDGAHSAAEVLARLGPSVRGGAGQGAP